MYIGCLHFNLHARYSVLPLIIFFLCFCSCQYSFCVFWYMQKVYGINIGGLMTFVNLKRHFVCSIVVGSCGVCVGCFFFSIIFLNQHRTDNRLIFYFFFLLTAVPQAAIFMLLCSQVQSFVHN